MAGNKTIKKISVLRVMYLPMQNQYFHSWLPIEIYKPSTYFRNIKRNILLTKNFTCKKVAEFISWIQVYKSARIHLLILNTLVTNNQVLNNKEI